MKIVPGRAQHPFGFLPVAPSRLPPPARLPKSQKQKSRKVGKYYTVGLGFRCKVFSIMKCSAMPHPTKRQRIDCHERNEEEAAADDDFLVSFDDLSDVLPNVLGYLTPKDIMCKRRINKKSREAVKKTIVPLSDFRVDNAEKYNAMNVMTEAMPNLQQITLRKPGYGGHKYSDGEDPDEEQAARTADYTTRDIGIISNFSKLRILEIRTYGTYALLNGRYPFLFNSFPLLQKLSLQHCDHLKWDLEMLAGLPLLNELDCEHNHRMTGNINSLRVLKDTLEKVRIDNCENVQGNFMDLADFPHLKELDVDSTAVIGDIRDISDNDFSALECLDIPKGVFGGWSYELQRISDAPDLVRAVYLFIKQRPSLEYYWFATLSEDSPDWYESGNRGDKEPPLYIHLVEAGSRLGYRWGNKYEYSCCEVNWLDPEPDRESSDYEKYIEELEVINSNVKFYKGFHQPPTEEEYHRLFED
jgi:hypothetical protein